MMFTIEKPAHYFRQVSERIRALTEWAFGSTARRAICTIQSSVGCLVIPARVTRRVSPAAILTGQAHDQFCDVPTEWRSSRIEGVPGAIELVSDELPKPGENGVRCHPSRLPRTEFERSPQRSSRNVLLIRLKRP